MKTVHIRYIILSLCIIAMICGTVSSAVPSEDGYGSSEYGYRGPYELESSHSVNAYYSSQEDVDKLQEILFREFLSWGMTPEGASAVVANIGCESGYDPTRTQGNVDWSDFSWGNTGLGLVQWTYWSLQADLFNTASSLGKKWTDLSVQFEAMKHIFGSDSGVYYLYEKGSGNPYNLAGRFMDDVERPAIRNYALRGKTAESIYNRFASIEACSYDGSYDGEWTGSPSGESGNTVTINGVTSYKIKEEWELTGMPISSGISEKIISVRMPGTLSNYHENHSLHQIGNDISLRNEFKMWEFARVSIVFIGMILVLYAVFLGWAMLMDNVNSFIDLSFVSLMSFGVLHYTKDMDSLVNPRKFISGKRLLAIISVILVVGLFCVSGGVYSYLLKAVYWVVSKVGG